MSAGRTCERCRQPLSESEQGIICASCAQRTVDLASNLTAKDSPRDTTSPVTNSPDASSPDANSTGANSTGANSTGANSTGAEALPANSTAAEHATIAYDSRVPAVESLGPRSGESPGASGPSGVPGSTGSDGSSAANDTGRPGFQPRRIADYEILSEIARGGMGVVYRARQLRLKRIVALKMILAGSLARDTDVERFRTEAQAAARLEHPGIVPVYEVGEHEGHHYFSMAYVPGVSLATRLAGGPLPATEAARLVRQIAEAAHFAHEHGIVHRDFKPANVLLAPDGTPKITDFGLAKSADSDSHLTATGQVLGTPSYMAPEQATGRQDLVGPATDVYSIGAVLYHCLTGRPPFQADNIVDTLNQVRHNEPVAPRVFNQKLPLDIEAICLKCLEKSAARRFASAAALAEELGRFERGEPVTTRPVGRATQLWRAVRRNKTQFAAASLAVLALLALAFGAATIVLTRLYRVAEFARQEAGRERVTAQFMKSRAEDSEQKTRQVLYTTDIARARMHYDRTEPAAMRAALRRQQPSGGAATQVGFEWYYLWRMAHQERHVLTGHREPAVAVAFSRDGKQLFSGDQSPNYARPGVVRRWSLAPNSVAAPTSPLDSASSNGATSPTGAELFTLRGSDKADYFLGMSAMRLSPDGKTLAVTDDSRVHLLDPQTGEIQRTLSGPTDFCQALAFTPDGRGLAVGALKSGVTLFDVSNGAVIRQFKAGELEAAEVAISPDGKRLAVGAGDSRGPDWSQLRTGEIRAWDLESGKELALCDGVDCLVTALTFTPDGKRIVAGLKNGEIAEWSTENWRRARTLREHRRAVNDVLFLRDGKRMVSVGDDAVVRVWNWDEGVVAETLKGHEGPIAAVAASPWEDLLATAGRDQSVRVWDLQSAASHATFRDFQWSIQAAGFSESGRAFFAADYQGAQIYDSSTLRRIASVPFGHWTFTAAMSPDGARIASGGNQGESGEPPATVKLWQVDGAKLVREFEPRLDTVTLVRFSPDGQVLAARGKLQETPQVVLWDVASGRELQRWENASCFDFSLDNRLVAVGGTDGLFIWQCDSREQRKVRESAKDEVRFTNDSTLLWIMMPNGVLRHVDLAGRAGVAAIPHVVDFAISPDRRWLCPTQSSGTSILNAVTTMPHATLAATSGGTRSFKLFSPDNRTLAEIGDVVRLWHVETGEPLLELDRYGLPVNVAAFSPDSQLLILGGGSRGENNGLWVFRAPRNEPAVGR